MALDALIGFVMAAIAVTMLLVIGNVLLGKLVTINEATLGNNTNATTAIYQGFSLLSTAQGIILLVIVVGLLGLALAYFMGVFGGNKRK